MSIQHFALFWAHSQSKGFARLVGVELAQRTSLSSGLAWPSTQVIAQNANGSTRSVTRGLSELVDELDEFEEVVMDDGRRAWRMLLACPADCDGSPAHNTRSAWDARSQHRQRERERRAAARAARRASGEDGPGSIEEITEGPIHDLSQTICLGQESPVEALSQTSCLGQERAVPDKLSGVSQPSCLGQGVDTSYRELEKEPPPERREEILEVEPLVTEASPGGAASGGESFNEVLEAIPAALRREIPRVRLVRQIDSAVERGISRSDLARLLRVKSWDGARTGALVAFLRDVTAADAPSRSGTPRRRVCEIHPDVELTAGHCTRCASESRERGLASEARPRPGESLEAWSERVGATTSSH